MSRKLHFSAILFLALYLFVQIAEAALLRTSGRGSRSSNFSQTFYYLDNQHLNQVGIKEASYTNLFANSISKTVGGGGRGLGAVPNTCINGYTQSDEHDKDQEINYLHDDFNDGKISQTERDQGIDKLNFDLYGEPCVWEFEQGEALNMFGFFSLFFDTQDVTYDVDWFVDGKEIAGGGINTTGDLATADGQIDKGWVTLNSAPIFDLAPGDYAVSVNVSIMSSKGKFFWENRDPSNPAGFEFNPTCIINDEHQPYIDALEKYNNYLYAVADHAADPINYPDPGPIAPPNPGDVEPAFEICGHPSIDFTSYDESFAPTLFSSEPEILRILAASADPQPDTNPVTTPNPLSILLLGLSTAFLTRRAKNSKK
ncbi:hypothetical protein L0668_11440 [Paraglaciecola aquimarina]|uniref:PEP-CTERM sorting domain-containing protein n=1 Tax=Paraglaciecola algarum TaxID=3050085 RepID=A0ABS9D6Z1_9ALTE|nr:hypothetical protein [Paraglaciecola sp. G1-23]MCF2948723.1 hypothetical protein [Paraglaciecola sp. G1-23]